MQLLFCYNYHSNRRLWGYRPFYKYWKSICDISNVNWCCFIYIFSRFPRFNSI